MEPREQLNCIGKHVESKGKKEQKTESRTLKLKRLAEQRLMKETHYSANTYLNAYFYSWQIVNKTGNTWFLPSLAYNQVCEIDIKQVNKQTLFTINCIKH